MRDMTHPFLGHDAFVCGMRLIHTWDATHSYRTDKWREHTEILNSVKYELTNLCVSCPMHVWDMTLS